MTESPSVRHMKIPYIRCECGFRYRNDRISQITFEHGDVCPKCGEELTYYNQLYRQDSRKALHLL